ncbi:MAG: alpha/beta fold hydrolase [Pseudomonadota bacterium]
MLGRMISDMMVKPHQSPVFDSPTAYGLDYEDVAFQARDGVTLRGWLIKGGTDKVIIQSHFGVQCCRSGWQRAGKGFMAPYKHDISFLRQAAHFAEQGYSVLMYDLRGHGASDLGTTPWVSWGPEEAKDVIAAVDFISGHAEYGQASIGLLSICMGAASTTYAYGLEDGLAERSSVKALVAVQPLLYKYFIEAYGMPGFLVRPAGKVTHERLGFAIDEPNFLDSAAKITVPTQVVQNRNDPWTNLDMVKAYLDGLTVEKDMFWLNLEKSRFAAYDHLGHAPAEFTTWFDKHL